MNGHAGEQGFTIIEMLIAVAILAVIATSISTFLLSNVRHSGKLQAYQKLSTAAKAHMEEVRRDWAEKGKFGNLSALPAVPDNCARSVAQPSVTVAGVTKVVNSRQVTLSCTLNGFTQAFSLEIPEP